MSNLLIKIEKIIRYLLVAYLGYVIFTILIGGLFGFILLQTNRESLIVVPIVFIVSIIEIMILVRFTKLIPIMAAIGIASWLAVFSYKQFDQSIYYYIMNENLISVLSSQIFLSMLWINIALKYFQRQTKVRD